MESPDGLRLSLRDQGIGMVAHGRYQDPIIGAVSAPTERASKALTVACDSKFSDPSLRFAR